MLSSNRSANSTAERIARENRKLDARGDTSMSETEQSTESEASGVVGSGTESNAPPGPVMNPIAV
jgi:hypothetical protein